MRISELAKRAAVPLSAVKYYQREGLLPDGVRSSPNQAEYGELHVKRLRLIRALLETGGLSIAAAKQVVGALDAEDAPLNLTFAIAQQALSALDTARGPVRDSVAAIDAMRSEPANAASGNRAAIDAAAATIEALDDAEAASVAALSARLGG